MVAARAGLRPAPTISTGHRIRGAAHSRDDVSTGQRIHGTTYSRDTVPTGHRTHRTTNSRDDVFTGQRIHETAYSRGTASTGRGRCGSETRPYNIHGTTYSRGGEGGRTTVLAQEHLRFCADVATAQIVRGCHRYRCPGGRNQGTLPAIPEL